MLVVVATGLRACGNYSEAETAGRDACRYFPNGVRVPGGDSSGANGTCVAE